MRALFDQTVGLPPPARGAFLDEHCAGDAVLRADVESLLQAGDAAGEFLEAPAVAEAADSLNPPEPELAAMPRRLGAYEVIREIGRGGMGTVYLARRADGGFRQMVAIKLMRDGMDRDFLRRRFIAERQILAELEHPYIARLYDGGATETAGRSSS